MKLQIEDALKSALQKLGLPNDSITVNESTNKKFGDYSTNIALRLAKKHNTNPYELGEKIAVAIPELADVMKVEVIQPGFINFWISKHFHFEQLNKIINDDKAFYESSLYLGKKIMFEYTDPNPFKEFHIGHLYSNAVGESLSRINEALGAKVKRANYYGDVGMHVAKSIWGMMKKMEEEHITLEQLGNLSLADRVAFLGQSYARGAQAYEDNEPAKKEMQDLNYAVFVAGQKYLQEKKHIQPTVDYQKFLEGKQIDLEKITKLYMSGKEWSLEAFNKMYELLGTTFDYDYPESMMAELGQKMVIENLQRGIFTKSQGAIIFEGEKYGLHNRVFINSLGLPTYEAKDLGNAPTKYKDFPYDKSYIITANEINEYFKVVLTALGKINPNLAKKTIHIGHGIVRLPDGKMSSRTGKVMTGQYLIDEVKREIVSVMKKDSVADSEKKEVVEKIAVAAIKFALLKQGIGSDIEFSLKESVSFSGNSGPYIQYTYVRCMSILKQTMNVHYDKSLRTYNDEENNLLRTISQFSSILFDAGQKNAPHAIANYLFTLAQSFSIFYEKHSVLKAEGMEKQTRLFLTAATAHTLKKGLWLLGIETVNHM